MALPHEVGSRRTTRPTADSRRRVVRRHAVLIAAIVVSVIQPAFSNPLIDSWAGVQQALVSGEVDKLEVGLQRLLTETRELGIRRATPFSAALAVAANNRPDDIAAMLLRASKRLDPLLPAPRFEAGRLAWRAGQRIEAVGEFATGIVNLLRNEPTRRGIVASIAPWIVSTCALVIVAIALIQIGRFVRLMGNDAFFLGSLLFGQVNAVIFACVALTLPLFAGLGPAWALVYLFSLTWSYMPVKQRATAVASLVLFGLLTPILEVWTGTCLNSVSLGSRVEKMLVQRTVDFATLREFVELEGSLGRSAAFHVVAGELLRTHGDRELARVHFEKAMREAPDAEVPRLYLGVLALEDRDPFRAQELLQEAVETNPTSVLGHYNLAIALDLTRRFDEGDASRRRARELAGREFAKIGLRGREDRMLYPKLNSQILETVVGDAPEKKRALLIGSEPGAPSLARVFSPFTLVSIFGLVFGGVVYWARRRWFGPARECVKCGKVFRPDDNTGYCGQCVSVFLKRNAVSIEQQSAKINQVRRWNALSAFSRRIAGVLVPGGSFAAEGKSLTGSLVAFAVWLPVMGAAMWVPLYLTQVEPSAPNLAFQLGLAAVGMVAWVVVAVSAWNRR